MGTLNTPRIFPVSYRVTFMLTDIPLLTDPYGADVASPSDIDGIIEWLSSRFQQLEDEGREVVDEYWRLLRVIQRGRSFWPRMTLGLRIRTRANGTFSLEWYGMGVMGRDQRPVERIHIAKGRRHSYSMKALLRRQPSWVAPLVLETETLLADIRCRLDQLIKIRDALGMYARKTGESEVSPSKLLEKHRLDHQLNALL